MRLLMATAAAAPGSRGAPAGRQGVQQAAADRGWVGSKARDRAWAGPRAARCGSARAAAGVARHTALRCAAWGVLSVLPFHRPRPHAPPLTLRAGRRRRPGAQRAQAVPRQRAAKWHHRRSVRAIGRRPRRPVGQLRGAIRQRRRRVREQRRRRQVRRKAVQRVRRERRARRPMGACGEGAEQQRVSRWPPGRVINQAAAAAGTGLTEGGGRGGSPFNLAEPLRAQP